ncbi:MAG TPA: hypothetical protein VNI78_08330 [Vicinamibacterales bacterium]|nr:hypothetical protein [Vicinamibacterales bacterium]
MLRTLLGCCLVLAAVTAAGAQSGDTPPRTPWGDPDLQGIWPSTHMVGVPFERPDRYGTRLMLTEDEFRERELAAAKQRELDTLDFDITNPPPEIVALGDVGDGTSPPPHWLERGEPSRQSSLIVDPPDGKLPPMTPEGKERQKLVKTTYLKRTGFSSPDELGPYDRCISRGVVGSMMPVVYNNGNEIVQAPGYVVLRNEMIHETRIIPLDGRPHVGPAIRSYMGDSRGWWEGHTLVVRTRNLNGRNGLQANGQTLLTSDEVEFIERFTRTGPDTLQYEVTIVDPRTWTRPFTVSFPLRRDPDYGLYEYACHEGNYSMTNTLSASRADEERSAGR